MNEPILFNPAAIERLLKLGGQKFALEMIDLFGSYGDKILGEARTACAAGNLTALANAAHPLRSSAGNLGAVRLQDLATQVEASARAQNAAQAGKEFLEMECAFAEAKVILAAERVRLTQPPA